MKKKGLGVLKWWGLLLVAAVLFGGAASVQAAGEIGKTIDRTNVAEYKDILIPHTYRAVAKGDFILKTANLPYEYTLGESFLAASEKNAGKFDVNAQGDLIDKAAGKAPVYNIYGLPFPHIDRNDPNAAVKIMWNFKFKNYRFMARRSYAGLFWVSEKDGLHRSGTGDGNLLYYTGRPPGQEIRNNPTGFLYQDLINFEAPMSIKGMNVMGWDYLDERDITQYAYIPAFRRVRQTSGAARSDPFQGSDGWLDLNDHGWAGKNRSMTWKLIGEKTVLVPFTTLQKRTLEVLADGAAMLYNPLIKFGYETPGWKGAKWAPTSVTWVPRKVWVISQMPRDPYYAWGLHIDYIDQETYSIYALEVHDKAAQFRTVVYQAFHMDETPDGRTTAGYRDLLLTIDEKARHASHVPESPSPKKTDMIFMPASRMDAKYFSLSNFIQISK